MPTFLDLDAWPRRAQFDFFRSYDNPFFSVCVDVDVSALRRWVDAHDRSFFLTCLYGSQRAANAVAPFRYRLRGDRVLVHDRVHAGSTILCDDETFAFGYFDDHEDFDRFHRHGQAVIERVRAEKTFDPRVDADDLIHYSVLPWMTFTSFSHARNWGTDDAIPKIVFGKYTETEGRLMMPVSVEVHHALMDGLHVGRYYERFAAFCAAPASVLDEARRGCR